MGLSPRVRGNRHQSRRYGEPAGSIPACAGEPHRRSNHAPATRVYPRVCGGTYVPLCRPDYLNGLSPRVRGNQSRANSATVVPGSIPACAGEPENRDIINAVSTVYPRVCGGTHLVDPRNQLNGGLSPRVRGNLPISSAQGVPMGSIPACAGEPIQLYTQIRIAGVYPRVCGGTLAILHRRRDRMGLSPRVRGNRAWWPYCKKLDGSIPACAGEPL